MASGHCLPFSLIKVGGREKAGGLCRHAAVILRNQSVSPVGLWLLPHTKPFKYPINHIPVHIPAGDGAEMAEGFPEVGHGAVQPGKVQCVDGCAEGFPGPLQSMGMALVGDPRAQRGLRVGPVGDGVPKFREPRAGMGADGERNRPVRERFPRGGKVGFRPEKQRALPGKLR